MATVSVLARTATVVVIAHKDVIEFRHTINSVLRAIHHAEHYVALDIVIFDEQQLYDSPYIVDDIRIRVIHKPTDLSSLTSSFIFTVPSRTLISKTWLIDAAMRMEEMRSHHVVRPQLQLTWGKDQAPTIIEQQTYFQPLYHILSPAYSGVVGIDRVLFLQEFENAKTPLLRDQLLEGLVWLGRESVIIPNTSAFTQTVPTEGTRDYTGLPIFNFSHAGKIDLGQPPTLPAPKTSTPDYAQNIRTLGIVALRHLHMLGLAKSVFHKKPRAQKAVVTSLPNWLINEWRDLHRIENRLFPSNYIIGHTTISKEPSVDAYMAASLYSQAARQITKDRYDYIFFVPWLVRGGADKFAIEYANTIHRLQPELHILVVATLHGGKSEWADKLHGDIDFCNIGSIVDGKPRQFQYLLIELLVRQSRAKTIHIINSALAYDFVHTHRGWLKSQGVKVVATSFSQEVLPNGRTAGYSHMDVPKVYDATSIITSDNETVLTMWRKEYGFDQNKLALHHLPFPLPRYPIKFKTNRAIMRVLWASRLSPEKMPEIVNKIGASLQNINISIDMYGTESPYFDTSFLQHCPPNVHYKGRFDGLSTLPLEEYDVFLYTSLFDGMPNTLLEIGAIGLPIISSAVGGITELIKNGVTGTLIFDVYNAAAYADALLRMMEDPALRVKLSQNLRKKIGREYSGDQFDSSVKAMLGKLGY